MGKNRQYLVVAVCIAMLQIAACSTCQSDADCVNGGKCPNPGASCRCPAGYTGGLCQRRSICASDSDCNNGGLCRNPTGGPCTCVGGYSGETCQTPPATGSCTSNLECRNGGTCLSPSGRCACVSGFTGDFCQGLSSVCDPGGSGCRNGGVCSSGGICNCPSEFTGSNCAIRTNCKTNANCQNSGSCVAGLCRCTVGFSGANCETSVSRDIILEDLLNNTSSATTVGISLTFEVPFPPILTQSEDATTRSVSSSFQNTVNNLISEEFNNVNVGDFVFGPGSTIAASVVKSSDRIDPNEISRIVTKQVLTASFPLPDDDGNIQEVEPDRGELALNREGQVEIVELSQARCLLIARCENGGRCEVVDGEAICRCRALYSGPSCGVNNTSIVAASTAVLSILFVGLVLLIIFHRKGILRKCARRPDTPQPQYRRHLDNRLQEQQRFPRHSNLYNFPGQPVFMTPGIHF